MEVSRWFGKPIGWSMASAGACVVLGLSGCQSSFETDFGKRLDEIAAIHGTMGMAAVVVSDGAVVAEYCQGWAHWEQQRPVTVDTRFRVASISKSITALACMRLVELGLLQLDESIQPHLGTAIQNVHHPEQAITPRMLLSHTSSLQDGEGYSAFLTATYATDSIPGLDQLLNPAGRWYTDDLYRKEAPGSFFCYSNLNYGVLATVMEAASGLPFDELVDSLIFRPMELGCSFGPPGLDSAPALACLYRYEADWVAQFDDIPSDPDERVLAPPGVNALRHSPQGGLRASVRDLWAFMHLFFHRGLAPKGNRILQPGSIAAMQADEWTHDGSNGDDYHGLFQSWGLGLHRITRITNKDLVLPGLNMVGHPGEAYGLVSDWYFDTATRDGIIFLTNGVQSGYTTDTTSAFYTVEKAVFDAATNAFFTGR